MEIIYILAAIVVMFRTGVILWSLPIKIVKMWIFISCILFFVVCATTFQIFRDELFDGGILGGIFIILVILIFFIIAGFLT